MCLIIFSCPVFSPSALIKIGRERPGGLDIATGGPDIARALVRPCGERVLFYIIIMTVY